MAGQRQGPTSVNGLWRRSGSIDAAQKPLKPTGANGLWSRSGSSLSEGATQAPSSIGGLWSGSGSGLSRSGSNVSGAERNSPAGIGGLWSRSGSGLSEGSERERRVNGRFGGSGSSLSGGAAEQRLSLPTLLEPTMSDGKRRSRGAVAIPKADGYKADIGHLDVREGPLLRHTGGLPALLSSRQERHWQLQYIRLDHFAGVLEIWEGGDAPEAGRPPAESIGLDQLIEVGQHIRELHLVMSVPRRFHADRSKQRTLKLKVPDDEDLSGWLSALARHVTAAVEMDI